MAVALAVVLTAGAAWLPATGQAQHTKLSLESIGPDGGNGAQSAELVGALSVGKRSFIRTAEPLVSSDNDSSLDVYERTGGSTTLVSTGPTGGNGAFPVNFGAAVEAGQTVVFQTEEQLTAADTDGAMDVYRRAGTVTTLVSTGPTGGNGPLDSYLVAADEGGTHIFFTTREALVGSDSDASLDIYERSGTTTTLVSTGSGGGNGDQNVELMDISDDGQTAVFETTESLVASDTDTMQDVYARSAGTTTLVSTGPVGGNGSSHATFNGLSANGSKIFFSTDEPMVAADTDASQDVYERSGGTTIIHTIGSTGGNGGARASYVGSSETGSRVFIETTERLNSVADRDGVIDVYESTGSGPATLVTPGANDGGGAANAYFVGASADGTRVLVRTEESIAAPDSDGHQDIYKREAGVVTLLSTGPAGGGGAVNAHFAGASDDATHVFIQTVEALVAGDTDSSNDVYEIYGGDTSLVTSGATGGNGAYDAVFRGVSPDGTRVFFRTAEALMSTDTDLTPDVYSANVPGTVTVQLNAMPDHAQDFSFTAIGLELGSFNFGPLGFGPTIFSLDDDPDPALINQEVFGQVTPGAGYSVSQAVPAGWNLTAATCDDGSPVGNIEVDAGEEVSCTFTDQKHGRVVVVVDAVPNNAQDFSFTAGGGLTPTSFSLDDDSDGTLSNTRTLNDVPTGAGYSLSQSSLPPGWDQGSATCSDGSPIGNINVGPDETVTCTFTNNKRGQIVVVKDAQPNSAEDFSFTAAGGLTPTSFILDDDSDGTLPNTQTFTNVAPGAGYSLSETVPAGWSQSSAICSDGSPVTNISVSIDETVTCTFVNNQRGRIIAVKDAQPDDPQNFSFAGGGGLTPSSFLLDDDTDPGLSNTRTFSDLVPRAGYSLSETVPSGWDQTSATCDDGSPVSNINVAPAETVTCTFTNRKRAQLVVVKDSLPDDPQDFGFTAGGGLSPAGFQLDDDANATLSNTRTFNDVVPGSGYSISETVPGGWDQQSASCSDGSPTSNVSLSAGETVTCTFTNRKRGQIVAVKDAVPNDPQDFSFAAGGGLSPTSFSLDDDADGTLSNTRTFAGVPAGNGYSLSETVPGGWDQTSATCGDGSPVSNIDVAPGETVTCTFTNRKRGQIVVTHNAVPDDAQDFSFTAGGGLSPASFTLDDDLDPTLASTRTFNDVPVGSGYSIAESVPAGWDLASATCNDGSPVSNIGVSDGETVTCTFTNHKRGQIVAVKDATPNDAQDFAFTAGGGLSPTSFSLDDDADGTLSNTRTFAGVPAGNGYSLSETVPGGWDQTSATCGDGSPVSNIDVAPGETVTCTFANSKRGSIVVVKDAQPNDAQDFAFTAGGGLSPTSFSLDDDADGTLSNTRTFANVAPGAGYSVSETVPSGWDQSSATCDDGSPVSNISVSTAETVTCTFVNKRRGQIVVVHDSVPNDAQDFDYTAGGGLSPSSFQLDDHSNPTLPNTITFTNVAAHAGYSISQTTPAGWGLTSATCNDGSPVSNIDVGANETVTCTFVSQQNGSLTIVKDSLPNDPQDFSFTVGGLSPSNFQLDDDSNNALSNTRTYSNVMVGTYSASEAVPAGWDQASATCSDGSPVSAINIGSGENVTCTFTNQKRGRIVAVLDTQPNDAQDFSFTAGGGLAPTSFQLDDDTDAALTNTRSFDDLPAAGGYSLGTAGVPAAWSLGSATCDDGSPVSNVNVAPGEVVTCTFTIQKRGEIAIVKDATPNDPQDFSFTTGGGLAPASFQLDDDSDGTLSNTGTFLGVTPGSGYSVAETVPSGWDQTSATCNDGSPVSNINVAPAEVVTCTFSNRKRGRIVIVKDATPDDPQDFSFTAGGGLSPTSFTLDDDANATLSNTHTFNDVVPASGYTIAESVPGGWDQTSATCDDGSSISNIAVAAGETVTCTFANRKRAQLVVVKDSLPNDAQDFSFAAGGGLSPTSFSLDDDADGTLSNTRTFASLTPGSGYSLSETVPGGWDQQSATCSDGSPTSNVSLSAGETVTCTFTNRKRGQIVAMKDAVPNDPQDFSFTAGGGLSPAAFSLDDDSDGTLAASRTFTDVMPGSGYSLAETVPGGWDQTAATCDDGSPVANIDVDAGEIVTCTFTNRKRGRIIVAHDAVPDDAQDFSFTAGGGLSPASFSLDDDLNPGLSNTHTFNDVPVGAGYSVAESVPAGWDLASATCDDGSSVSNIGVAAGETVTCTFTNHKRGQVVVVKDATPNDPQDFSFSAGGGLSPTSFTLDDDANATLSNTRTFADVPAGNGYSLSETVPGGWDQTSATCGDGSPVSNIDVAPGETVTCTFANRKRGTIVVVKDAQPNDAQDFAFSAGGGLSPASFALDDDANGTLSNTRTFANVPPGGGYSLSETVPSGWDQTSATCDDGSSASNISVSAGETVTCTFTNEKRGRIVITADSVPNDPQDFSFTAGGGLSPANIQLDDDSDGTLPNIHTFDEVLPGSGYSVSETVPSGWDQASASCDDGSPVSNIDVSLGETVMCSFTNHKHGQVVVVKDALPDDPQDFSFTAGGGLTPTSFSLDDDANATLSNSRTFADVPVGAGYTLSESVPGGWDQTSATCDDGSPVSNINVAPGEVVTCTFQNRKRGRIVVTHDAVPDSAQDFSFTAGGGLSPASFSLDDDLDPALTNTRTFNDVPIGSGYSIAETVPAGWDLESASCDDSSPVSNISVSAGETVTCSFTNHKRGQVVVVKDATPDGPQDFSFAAGGGLAPTSFSLDDDSNGALSNTRTFADVPAGNGYSVSETVPGGWDQTSATCGDGSPVSNIDVAPGETVTCTFANRKRGSIVIVKDAQPNDAQDFSFTAGGGLSPGGFSLDDDSDGTLSNSRTFANVAPGAGYSVSETVPSGWDQASASCDDGSPVSNIDVEAGETVTCTFTNERRGRIVVVKNSVPNDAQDFSFTAGGGLSPSSFDLDDDSDPTLSNSHTFADVPPGGGYSISETVPSGWDQTAATCDDGSSPASISVSVGETVTCTFTNRKRGRIVVVKDAQPNDAQDFSFTAGGGLSPASFDLDDDSDPTLASSRTFTNVVPGSGYSVSETVPSGWDQTAATCDDGSPVSNVAVAAGETVTCTFQNSRRGQVSITKNAVPDDPQDFAFTAGGGLSPAAFSLDDDLNPTLANTHVFEDVPVGSGYSLAETVPGGWDQSSATCDDGSPVSNISVSAGEHVSCTFTNAKRGTIVVVKDAVPNNAQDFAFTAGGGLTPTSFSLDDDSNGTLSNTRTFTNVLPGNGYTLSETLPSGWDQTDASCDDGSSVSNIDVAPGEIVTCTFTNGQRGRIVAVKEATPNDPQDFSFTAGGGLSPSSFSLDDDADGTLSNSHTFLDLAPGSGYSLSETVPSGWDQTGATCDDGSAVSNIDVAAGETVTCTFSNRKRGSLVVVEDAVPNEAQDFSFTAGGGLSPSSFSLDDDSDGALSNTRTFANLVPGSGYSVSQSTPAGWDLDSATCDDGSPVSNVAVAPGETVTCTFLDHRHGSVTAVKHAQPEHPQDFSFTAGGGLSPTSFSLDDDADATLSNTRTFTGVSAQGGYTLAETVPGGWDQSAATCDDGSPVSNIDVAPGEHVTCTFTNRLRGSIVVVQDSQPNDPQDFSFAGGGLSPGSFSLDDDADGTLSNTRTFASVPATSGYSISQTLPSGWLLAGASCDDGSPVSNIDVGPGETVTCTFENSKRGQIVVVKDATPTDPQDFSFTAGGGLSPSSFALDDDSDGTLSNSRTFANVTPGSGYSVSESLPSGWEQTGATCDDGSNPSSIDVSAGEVVTCTFSNRKFGKVVVVKDAVPNEPQDFSFTAGGGLTPSSFALDDDSDGTLSNSRTFNDVRPGSGYSVTESAASGWSQVSATCSDGSPTSNIGVSAGETVTCTFVNTRGYPRPGGATPLRAPMVVAYANCASPNRSHGPALEFPSCNPPVQTSTRLTVGTPDANSRSASMVGFVRFGVLNGNTGTPADEADVTIEARVTDVRTTAGLNDYTGELEGRVSLRITDRLNGTGQNEGATVTDSPFSFAVPCTATSGSGNVGSTCALNTSADAVVPGLVVETKRTIWQMGDVELRDGGPDGVASTQDNTRFARQGIFVP